MGYKPVLSCDQLTTSITAQIGSCESFKPFFLLSFLFLFSKKFSFYLLKLAHFVCIPINFHNSLEIFPSEKYFICHVSLAKLRDDEGPIALAGASCVCWPEKRPLGGSAYTSTLTLSECTCKLIFLQGLRGIASLLVVTRYVVSKLGSKILWHSNHGLVYAMLTPGRLKAICLDRSPTPSFSQLRTAPTWALSSTYLSFVYRPKEHHGCLSSSS